MNRSNLSAFGCVGSTQLARRHRRTALSCCAMWNGSASFSASARSRNVDANTWTAMLPAQNTSEPSALRCSATSSGKSLYSITCTRPSIVDEIAELVLRRLLGDGHRRELRFGEQVVADELRDRRSA